MSKHVVNTPADGSDATVRRSVRYGPGKGDPLVTRWELNQALLKRLRKRATSVRDALARIEQGTCGVCERCGGPIDPDRMAALPDTRLCIRCAHDQPTDQARQHVGEGTVQAITSNEVITEGRPV